MDKSYIVIGLGSMGKRRIRNLQALGVQNIVGFDLRLDRCKEATSKYGIKTFSDFSKVLHLTEALAFIISLPPDLHHEYMRKAIELKIPAFIEASVVDTNFDELIRESKLAGVLLAPSCTLHFHPAIQLIKNLVSSGYLGNISNYLYHSGQFLPDWHSYEHVSDFYVSKKETGGGREIVPFELTWITLFLGLPQRVVGLYKKTIDISGAENIDDTYNILLDYRTFIFNLSVDVVSRCATRRLVINGDQKQLYWSWDENIIKVFHPESNFWEEIKYETLAAENSYNKNITEQMYIDEMQTFLSAIHGKGKYPNSLEHDHNVLKILYSVEAASDQNIIINL